MKILNFQLHKEQEFHKGAFKKAFYFSPVIYFSSELGSLCHKGVKGVITPKFNNSRRCIYLIDSIHYKPVCKTIGGRTCSLEICRPNISLIGECEQSPLQSTRLCRQVAAGAQKKVCFRKMKPFTPTYNMGPCTSVFFDTTRRDVVTHVRNQFFNG